MTNYKPLFKIEIIILITKSNQVLQLQMDMTSM